MVATRPSKRSHRKAEVGSSSPTGESHPPEKGNASIHRAGHWAEKIFIGPSGLRVPWRLLIAICLFGVILGVLFIPAVSIPAIRAVLPQGKNVVITPALLLFSDGVQSLAIVLTALVMCSIERRSFADYGAPIKEAFGKHFWQGMPFGFAMITMLIGLIVISHGFVLGRPALDASVAVQYALLYLLGFVFVGIFEEFCFRGYFQATLGSAIGFWPAALILAVVFGAIHLGNSGEAAFGALTAGVFGLVCAFSLKRTGSIWFAMGMHTGWDWGETYFYSVPDSGVQASGHLFNSSFHGPNWLTGGTVGPEASIFVLLILAIAAALIHFMFPGKRTEP